MQIEFALCAAAALVLAGCAGKPSDGQAAEGPASSATSASSTTSAPATSTAAATSPQAAPVAGDQPTKEFLVGKWGTDGDCTLAIDLRADGTSDGPFGNWSYTDGAISFTEAPELKINVTVIDDQTMESQSDNGKTAKMTRCP